MQSQSAPGPGSDSPAPAPSARLFTGARGVQVTLVEAEARLTVPGSLLQPVWAAAVQPSIWTCCKFTNDGDPSGHWCKLACFLNCSDVLLAVWGVSLLRTVARFPLLLLHCLQTSVPGSLLQPVWSAAVKPSIWTFREFTIDGDPSGHLCELACFLNHSDMPLTVLDGSLLRAVDQFLLLLLHLL